MDKELEIATIIAEMRKSHIGNESFKKVAEKIVNSDAFRTSTDKELEIILIDLMHCVFEKTKGKLVKVYGSSRFSQTELIKAKLYATEVPLLDFSIK